MDVPTTGVPPLVVESARVPFGRTQVVVQAVLCVIWTVGAVTEGDWFRAALAVVFGALAVAYLAMVIGVARTRVVVSADLLRVERPASQAAVARAAVRGVRGDVRGRPSWSDRVVVLTADGEVTLPRLATPPGGLIPVLQRWADAGEGPEDQAEV